MFCGKLYARNINISGYVEKVIFNKCEFIHNLLFNLFKMGLLLGKLRRKKTAIQELETIDKEIKSLESSRKDTELTRRRIVGRFVLYSVIVYVIVAFVFYFFFFPASFYDRLYYIMPLIIAPPIIVMLKKVMAWHFNRKITKTQSQLAKLQDDKKKLLDKVMETETYKVAKQILDKYASEQIKKPNTTSAIASYTPIAGLRQRNLPKDATPTATPVKAPQPFVHTAPKSAIPPVFNTPISQYQTSTSHQNIVTKQGASFAMPPPQTPARAFSTVPPMTPSLPTPSVPTPKSILPRDRSVIDKMVDFLVGDGPSNRYALICQYCFSHNGMALREEAKFTSFRCCYCFALNPALVKKLQAPKLDFDMSQNLRRATLSSSSESDKRESSDSEEDDTKKLLEKNFLKQSPEPAEIDGTEVDSGERRTSFSQLQRSLSEIESTIAEIKKAEVESVKSELNSLRKEFTGPESELASFEFLSMGNTSDDFQQEDKKESPDKEGTESKSEIRNEHDNSNQNTEESNGSLQPSQD